MAKRIQLRRDTAANWASVNPTLADGEIGVDKTNGVFKIGNGSTAWNDLPAYEAEVTEEAIEDALGYVPTSAEDVNEAVSTGIGNAPFVPTSRTITINGVTHDLSQNRSWTVEGGEGSGVEVNVDAYGAVGDGITDDTEAINSAITAAGAGAIIRFTPNKTYLISDSLAPLAFQILIGYGASVKRCDEIKTTLSAPAVSGTTSITVEDASRFTVGDRLYLTDVSGPYEGVAGSDSSLNGSNVEGNEVVSIVGNTITFSTGINLPASGNLDAAGEYPITTPVYKQFDMFQCASVNKFYGLTFDGNRTNNSGNNYWTINACIATLRSGGVVQDCTFHDMPSECIVVADNCHIVGNMAYDLQGSFVHVSDGDTTLVGKNIIALNNIRNTCLSPRAVAEHNEGVITASARTVKTLIIGNIIEDANGMLLGGLFSNDDFEAFIKDNTCLNVDGILNYRARAGMPAYDVQIIGNHFYNCRDILFDTSLSNLSADGGQDRIQIIGNNFVNGQISILQASNLQIQNNNFVFTEGYAFPDDSARTAATSVISFTGMNVSIDGNTLDNRRSTEGSIWITAISLADGNTTTRVNSSNGVQSSYSYWRNVSIHNNKILGFSQAFGSPRTSGSGNEYTYQGWKITDNIIVMRANPTGTNPATTKKAMQVYPGMLVKGNRIYGSSDYTYGLWVFGVLDAGSGLKDQINGAFVEDNYIIGFTASARLGVSAESTANGNNIYFTNNKISSEPLDYTSSNSLVDGNITVIAETPMLQLTRENPDYY